MRYSRLAARLLASYVEKEVRNQGVASFSQPVTLGHAEGLIGDETARFLEDDAFMELENVQDLSNFFERMVSVY